MTLFSSSCQSQIDQSPLFVPELSISIHTISDLRKQFLHNANSEPRVLLFLLNFCPNCNSLS